MRYAALYQRSSGTEENPVCSSYTPSICATKLNGVTFKKTASLIVHQPEGRFWQEPEPSQATGMALAHCILGSFLGVGCHCFPPPLDVPTFAFRCLHVQATWETSISERRNYGREKAGQFCLWFISMGNATENLQTSKWFESLNCIKRKV